MRKRGKRTSKVGLKSDVHLLVKGEREHLQLFIVVDNDFRGLFGAELVGEASSGGLGDENLLFISLSSRLHHD